MQKILSVLWGASGTALNLVQDLEVRCWRETVQRIMLVRRINCPDPELRHRLASYTADLNVLTDVLLVGSQCTGRQIFVQDLKSPDFRQLFALVWCFPALCRENAIVFPEFHQQNPIALVPQGKDFLLCAPPPEMLSARHPRILTLRA